MVKTIRYYVSSWVRIVTCILLCLVSSISLSAQRIEVDAPQSIEPGRHFNVTYSIATSNAELLESPQYKGLELLYGPAVSFSVSSATVNGRVTHNQRVMTWVYTFVAPTKGVATLSPIVVNVEGKEIKSAPVKIKVLPEETRPTKEGEAYFMYRLLLPNKKTYYLQEAIPISYRFYATKGFDPLVNLMNTLQFDGFLSTNLFEGTSGERQILAEQIDGRNYRAVDIHKYLLYPQREGELTIPGHEFPFRINTEPTPSNPFGSMEERSERAAPTSIRIVPLPTEGKPEDFSGAVGSFSVRSELNNPTPSVGDALTIKFIIEGSGNLKVASNPNPKFDLDFDTYEPEVKYDYSVEGNTLREVKAITYTLIPRKEGRFVIPPITFSCFDTSSGKYLSLSGKGYEVNVSASKRTIAQPLSVQGSADKSLSELLLQRTEGVTPNSTSSTLIGWIIYLSLYVLIIVVAGIVNVLLNRRDKAREDVLGYNASKANSVARKRLRRAEELSKSGAEEEFYQELLTALWGYLGHKLQIPPAELNREIIAQLLEQRGVETDVILSCGEALDAVEFARFAPGSASDKMQSIYIQAVEVIEAIENNKLDK